MVAFIKQEASEKAREISMKADEEANIEKQKLVRQETAAIDALYERKYKTAELAQQIARSTVNNKARLRVLAARQQLLDDIFEAARGRLADVAADKKGYAAVLAKLVLEGLFALGEDRVALRARAQDRKLLDAAIKDAKAQYKAASGRDVEIEIDEEQPLAEDS